MSSRLQTIAPLLALLTACAAMPATVDDAPSSRATPDGKTPTEPSDEGADRVGTDGGASSAGRFGIVSCQPAFEEACKPSITLVNDDPNGRGKVFTKAIPDIEKAEQEIACTTCSILYRTPSEIPKDKHPAQIKIMLDTHGGVADAEGDTIRFDLDYIASYANSSADVVEREMLGVLLHETVHLYQNYGNAGTGEGLADLVRARVGYYEKSRWASYQGTWKDPYTTSGNFYSWLTGPCALHSTFYAEHDLDFPYKLNKALAGKTGDASFTAVSGLIETTFGESVDDLWAEYQKTAF